MKARLMASAAVAVLLSSGSVLAASTMTPNASPTASSSAILSTGFTMAANDAVASRIMGAKVYDGIGQNAQQIGTINDLVLDQRGNVAAAVIGVGGFLGVGQKNVAVGYDQLSWQANTDGSARAVLNTTKDALNAAPAFNYPANDAQAMNAAPAASTATPTQQPAPAATNQASNSTTLTDANGNPVQPEVNPASLKPVDLASMKTDDLKGIDVIGPQGQKLGSINDFVLTKDTGKVDAVVVDFGGFLGIGTKQVAISYNHLKLVTDPNNKRYLEVNVTKDQLNAQQAYNKDTYAQDRAQQLMRVTS